MRIFLQTFIVSLLLLIVVRAANAATDVTSMTISVGEAEYVHFIGTAPGINKTLLIEDIQPPGLQGPGPAVSIGTLGLESNVPGRCTISISTQNNFRLLHTITNVKLTRYRLKYRNKGLSRRHTQRRYSCNAALSSLDFIAEGRFNNDIKAGHYSDVVTLTVTTQ